MPSLEIREISDADNLLFPFVWESAAFRKEKQFNLLEAAMRNKGCTTIPGILFENITFLSKVLPARSVPTFIELLIGAMITQSGFGTQALLAINPLRTWTSYYKWVEYGK